MSTSTQHQAASLPGVRSRPHHWTGVSGMRQLRRAEMVGREVQVTGRVLVRGRGEVVIGDGVILDAGEAPIELLAATGGRLELEAGVYVGPGASLEAGKAVTVRAGAVVGPYAKVLDNNWHGTSDRGGRPESTPVVIGVGARVGARATMVPGATLGDGSVLADDSVLSGRVPAGVVVAGVPARLVRKLADREQPEPAAWLPGPGRIPVEPFRQVSDRPTVVDRATLRALGLYEDLERLPMPAGGHPILARIELAAARLNGRRRLRSAQQSRRAVVHGGLEVRNAGRLHLGEGCGFAGGPVASCLDVGSGATLSIGADAVINYGVLIRAKESIRIGRRLLMGSRSLILDTLDGVTAPVIVGDDVWLAHGVTVLPGVTIGDGAAVSAGTVVDRDVPAGSLAVGSPPKFRPLPAVRK